ncbi:hypothetical protein [Micromonospora sp. WMMD980]|uniref:hypothetical protein n=1 Tax=Micromonospora sp. WMMD980 TaxID=3016088 RepID=UPI0024167543|nr:hypothetical protein [Micromonospora sp. WMMD980]MDG4801749.1 hypothetical protein [Micromonospora sp. WMMD980]
MDLFDADIVRTPEAREEYDLMTFEERDELDAAHADRMREELTGLPARPGTRR